VVPDLYNFKSRSAIETEKQDARHLPIMVDAVVENPTSRNLATSFAPSKQIWVIHASGSKPRPFLASSLHLDTIVAAPSLDLPRRRCTLPSRT
jgi:hypothetical protein